MLEMEGEVSRGVMEDLPGREPKARRSHLEAASIREERRVVVVGDSPLRGTQGPVCRPAPNHQEARCLPAARVKGRTRKSQGC